MIFVLIIVASNILWNPGGWPLWDSNQEGPPRYREPKPPKPIKDGSWVKGTSSNRGPY